jgi:hypothetical protein
MEVKQDDLPCVPEDPKDCVLACQKALNRGQYIDAQ